MDKIVINGGKELHGEIVISGAKNATLPELCATLLSAEPIQLHNVPLLRDVTTMLNLLSSMGVTSQVNGNTFSLNAVALHKQAEASYDLVKTMRASILVLGPLLSRHGYARVSMPGGCAIGARPVEQHIKGLQQMGALISVDNGYIQAVLPTGQQRLHGASITTDMITVTGTANLLMAATLAEGQTVLENAACEPEITDLAEMLIKMGAKISGHGTNRIVIDGVAELHGCTHQVVSDRIEAGTFLCAVAVAGGDITLREIEPKYLEAVLEKLEQAGVKITRKARNIRAQSAGVASLVAQSFKTSEYPSFPTDMQAQFMALNVVASGVSMVTETIFENRFMHVNELMRLGAKISIDGRIAMVEGGAKLTGAKVMATDLRASACLIIAALVAEGQTTIDRIYHLDRGYEKIEQKLGKVGADIRRTKG